MRDIDRYFVGTGIVLAIVGMALGMVMGMQQDFTLAPVHAHINLVGWVTLVLFGLAYRAGVARNDRWAVAHFFVAATGAVIFPIGIYFSMVDQQEALVGIGGLLTFASMLLFLVNYLRGRGTPIGDLR
jgi:hypothetical protein